MKAINVGVASHITAAAPNGPRFNPTLTAEQRTSIDNGIWLCQKCGKLVDNDAARYPVEQLREWKRLAEDRAVRELEGGGRRPYAKNAGIVFQGPTAINISGTNAAHIEPLPILKIKRLRRLHKRFHRASEQFPFLRYIAATGQDNIPNWPRIPHRYHPQTDSYGLTKGDWLEIAGRPTGSVFTPLGNTQWLHFDGKLWEGTFYFDGKETNPTNNEPGLLKQQYEALKGALEKFELLATEAAGLLAPLPSPHPMVDFPRKPDQWHRWVEELCQRACPEEPGLFSFRVRRVQFNVFLASALLMEEVETVRRDKPPSSSAAGSPVSTEQSAPAAHPQQSDCSICSPITGPAAKPSTATPSAEDTDQSETRTSATSDTESPVAEDILFDTEFSLRTVDLSRLQGHVDALCSTLAAYHCWVDEHGYASVTTVEALLNSVFVANDKLYQWAKEHSHWMKRASTTTVQDGLWSLTEILEEATTRIYRTIPNDHTISHDGPGYIRLPVDLELFRFDPVIISQIEMAANSIRAWRTDMKLGNYDDVEGKSGGPRSDSMMPRLASDGVSLAGELADRTACDHLGSNSDQPSSRERSLKLGAVAGPTTAKSIQEELENLMWRWARVTVNYDSSDPESVKQARSAVIADAVEIFVDRFGELAHRIIQFVGRERFPASIPDPPRIQGDFSLLEIQEAIFGTKDLLMAAKLAFLWAASAKHERWYPVRRHFRNVVHHWLAGTILNITAKDNGDGSLAAPNEVLEVPYLAFKFIVDPAATNETPANPAETDGPTTIEDVARVIKSPAKGTIRNRMSKAKANHPPPKPVGESRGARAAIYPYQQIRAWLVVEFPDAAARLPLDFVSFRDALQRVQP